MKPHVSMKPERNAPCPCGSGKVFEKCCQGWYEAKSSVKKVVPTATECNQLVALLNAGHLTELENRTRLLLEQYPESGIVWNLLGVSLQMQGKDGLPALQNATKFLPNEAEVHSNLGNALSDLGRLDEAEASYQRALKINPYNANAHSNLGITLGDLGRLDEAEASYRRALQIRPDVVEVLNNLGNILSDLGRLDEAEASYQRALQINPDFAGAHVSLGNLLYYLGDIDQAIAAYQKALTIDPGNIGLVAAVSLAKLYFLGGSLEQCRGMLDVSRPINATSTNITSAHKNARIYRDYLSLLLTKCQEPNGGRYQRKDIDTLYVVGESHSLSAHGVVVSYDGREMNCTAEWIEGCKQWHLGNNKPNKFKYKFERTLEVLPRGSIILLLIGEIDCRPDEGIIRAWKKSKGKSLENVVKDTVVPYVLYVAKVAAKFGHRVIVGGIPATNIRLDALDTETAGQLVELIGLFNAFLKDRTLVAGMDFLDLYALTDRGDGIASEEWHIDSNHLLPFAINEAFNKYLVAPEYSGSNLSVCGQKASSTSN